MCVEITSFARVEGKYHRYSHVQQPLGSEGARDPSSMASMAHSMALHVLAFSSEESKVSLPSSTAVSHGCNFQSQLQMHTPITHLIAVL